MPHATRFLPLLLVFALVSQVPADEESDRAALRQLKATYEEAVSKNDLARITPFLSPKFTGVMVTGEEIRNLGELEAYWKRIRGLLGENGSYSVKATPGEVIFSGDLAICTGTAEELVQAKGQSFPFTSAWTVICRRDGAGWKIERLQATMDPVNNVFVRARMRGSGILYGIASFIMGALVAGLILTGLSRSKAARAAQT